MTKSDGVVGSLAILVRCDQGPPKPHPPEQADADVNNSVSQPSKEDTTRSAETPNHRILRFCEPSVTLPPGISTVHERERSQRRKSREKERERRKSWENERERVRSVERERERKRSVERERERRKSVEKDRERKRSVERERERKKSVERDRERKKSVERDRERKKSLERDREKKKSVERDRERKKSLERDRERRKSIEKHRERRKSTEAIPKKQDKGPSKMLKMMTFEEEIMNYAREELAFKESLLEEKKEEVERCTLRESISFSINLVQQIKSARSSIDLLTAVNNEDNAVTEVMYSEV